MIFSRYFCILKLYHFNNKIKVYQDEIRASRNSKKKSRFGVK